MLISKQSWKFVPIFRVGTLLFTTGVEFVEILLSNLSTTATPACSQQAQPRGIHVEYK